MFEFGRRASDCIYGARLQLSSSYRSTGRLRFHHIFSLLEEPLGEMISSIANARNEAERTLAAAKDVRERE